MPKLTITTSAAQAQRIATAFGRLKNRREPDKTKRNATAAEVKADVIDFIPICNRIKICFSKEASVQRET